MSESFSKLNFEERKRAGVQLPGGLFKTAHTFMDFIVDGQSLYEIIGNKIDGISPFCFDFPHVEIEKTAQSLLQKIPGDFPSGRVAVYVCGECGDIGCGAISIDLSITEETVTWARFGRENNYEDEIVFEPYQRFGPFHFERSEYESAILAVASKLKTNG